MAFLQLKKDHNKDRPIDVQFCQNANSITPQSKKHGDNTWNEYRLKCINIGGNYKPQVDSDYEIRTGQDFELVMSDALYNKIVDYQSGEIVTIEMASNPNKPGQVFWKVRPSEKEWTKGVENIKPVNESAYGYDSVKERDIDKKLDILFGMAFNNSTRLVSSTDMLPSEKVKAIKQILPDMFKIAQSMDEMIVVNEPENDDDVPF